jgi:hypothetical protein
VVIATAAFMSRGGCEAAEIGFNQQIKPILAEHCLHCHGPDKERLEGDLRLDIESDSKTTAIVPNRPDESELIRRIVSEDPDERMPPPETGKEMTTAETVDRRRCKIRRALGF